MTAFAQNTRRRRGALLATSMLSTVAMAAFAGVGVSLIPEAAEAAACNPVATALYCNGPVATNTASGFSTVDLGAAPPNGTGVPLTATGTQSFTNTGVGAGLTVTLETGSSINTTTGDGLDLTTDHAAVLNANGPIATTAGEGVSITTTTASGSIVANLGNSITGGLDAFNAAAAGAADVTINVTGNGSTLQGDPGSGAGIKATTVGGNVVVNAGFTGNPATITGAVGIEAANTGGAGGNVTVLSSDAVSSSRGDGILATSNGSGFVTVGYDLTTSIAVPVTGSVIGAANGIDATNTGTGNIIVETGFSTITGNGAGKSGINAVASGATADVTVSAVDSNITGKIEGINAISAGSGGVTVESTISPGVHLGTVGAITSSNGDGIFAKTASGTINIGLALNPVTTGLTQITGITGGDGNGIFARTTSGGDINAYVGTGLYTGLDGNGIWLDGESGGNLTLNASGSSFVGSQAGIATSTFGAGAITITGTGISAIGQDGPGISAAGQNGDINIGSSTSRITTGASIDNDIASANDVAIGAQSVGSGAVTIYTGSGFFSGGATSVNTGAITALGQGAGQITVDMAGSSINGGYDGVFAASSGNGAITVNALSAYIVGSGGHGVEAATTGATAGVTVNVTDSAIFGHFAGIFATASGTGNVTVLDTITPGAHLVGTAGVVQAANGDGIFASSGSGVVNIGTALNPIITANNIVNGITGTGGNGIAAKTTSGGAINLYLGGGLVTGTDGHGAFLNGAADTNLTLSAVNTSFNGSESGIVAATAGTGTITINSTGGAVIGVNGSGIFATAFNGDINIGSSANRITTGFGIDTDVGSTSGAAISAVSFGTGAVNVFTGSGGFNTTTNAPNSAGIVATGAAGAPVTVDMNGSSVSGNYDGVLAQTIGAGTVTVNADAAFIAGPGHHGVDAITTGTGDVSFSGVDTVVKGDLAGIFAQTTGAGNVTILDTISPGVHLVGTAGVVSASNGDAIFGGTGSGTVNIGTALNPIVTANNAVNGITGTGGNGISAVTTAGGAINLYTGGGLITGTGGGEGAFLDGGPGAVVTVNAVNTSFNGDDAGIVADTAGAGTVTINSAGGALIGNTGAGVSASAQDGAINIGLSTSRITTGTTITTGAYSVSGDAIGGGTFGTGAVNIYTGAGLYRSDAGVAGSAGIAGSSAGGGSVTIDMAGSTVDGFDGVTGASTTGTVTLNASGGVVTGVRNGLSASTAGQIGVTVGAGELITAATDHAIVTASSGAGANIQISGTAASPTVVQSLGGASTAVIDVAQASGSETLVVNGSNATIRSLTAGFGDLIFHASGTTGTVGVANTGLMEGSINLGGLTDAGATQALSSNTLVDNGLGGVWHTTGTSTFGSGGVHGIDELRNIGTLTTGGQLTTFAFGASTTNTLINTGTLRVGYSALPTPFAASLVITHLGAFNNSGTIDLTDGATTPDRSLTAAGATFTGSGASLIKADAQLAGPGSTADTLAVGSTAGSTSIQVHDVSAAPGANTGPAGITLVTTSGANSASAFTLDPGSTGYHVLSGQGVLEKGLFFYALHNNPNASILVSALGPQAYEFSDITSGAQQIWYAATPWQDRQADLRDEDMMGTHGAGFEPGLWLKAVGDWADRSQSVSPMPGFKFDTSYRQQTGGLIGGWDATKGDLSHGGGEGLFGVSVGYLDSRLNFKQSATLDQYEGWTAGVYATYLTGQFFLDAHLKTDQLKLKVDSSLPFNGSANANTWGGQVDTGLRLPLGGGVMLEPVGTLAYVKTQIGDFAVAGTTVHTADNDSFRGGLGLRLSGTLASSDQYTLKLAGEARLWDEFADGNRTTLISSGPPLDVVDSIKGTFGEVGASINMLGKDGHSSGFFNTSVKFKGGYTDDKVAIGFRYQWGGEAVAASH